MTSDEKTRQNFAHGDLGERTVAARLAQRNWIVQKPTIDAGEPRSTLVDFEIILKDKEGKILRHELAEVKAQKSWNYAFKIKCLALNVDLVRKYSEYAQNRNLILNIFWVNFRTREILVQDLRNLMLPVIVKSEQFPLKIENFNKELILFPRAAFRLFAKIDDTELLKFYEIYPEEKGFFYETNEWKSKISMIQTASGCDRESAIEFLEKYAKA